uniref:Uncharacterized protein n=1 Tax=Ditylenchus dipsaci TaxID=166011 RepID=A0A915CQW1_9BILA
MGKSAYGMRYWEPASYLFAELRSNFRHNKEATSYIERTQSRLKETKGKYKLGDLYRQAVDNGCQNLDVADYVGPIKVSDLADKGRGVITTRDVVKGTLLLVSKAFSLLMKIC